MKQGVILYEGPSRLDGKPIVVIGTAGSSNIKTGKMVQTWILRSDIPPMEATRSGADSSICGDCPQRWHKGGACYVLVFQAPGNIYKSYKAGKYTRDWNADTFKDAAIRLGAYGDPCAVPVEIWETITSKAKKYTGYSHQWAQPGNEEYRKFCMASVESLELYSKAIEKGWRTFRMTDKETKDKNEIICPNTTVGVSCEKCGLCNGTKSQAKNIIVETHGIRKKRYQNNI